MSTIQFDDVDDFINELRGGKVYRNFVRIAILGGTPPVIEATAVVDVATGEILGDRDLVRLRIDSHDVEIIKSKIESACETLGVEVRTGHYISA